MNRLLFYILLFSCILSCNNIDKPKKPDNLISKNKMIDIITDISLVNAAKGVNKKLIEGNGINPANYIYEKHDIDSIQFAESNNYYAYDVKGYEKIYISVKQRLEKEKKKYKELEEKERKEKDSIRKQKIKKRDSVKRSNKNNYSKKSKSPDLLKKERTLQK